MTNITVVGSASYPDPNQPVKIRHYDAGRTSRKGKVHMLLSTYPAKTLCGLVLRWKRNSYPSGPEKIAMMEDWMYPDRENFEWITCKRCKKLTE